MNTSYEVFEEMTHFESTVEQSSPSLTVYYNKIVTIQCILRDQIFYFVLTMSHLMVISNGNFIITVNIITLKRGYFQGDHRIH